VGPQGLILQERKLGTWEVGVGLEVPTDSRKDLGYRLRE
jgi:hypothetical protein